MEGINVLPTRQTVVVTPKLRSTPDAPASPSTVKATTFTPVVSPRWANKPPAARCSGTRFSSLRSSGVRASGNRSSGSKPFISEAQLMREAHIKNVAVEAFRDFTSTVTNVRVVNGKKSMRTTVPEKLKVLFGCEDMLTLDGWKFTERGNFQTNISAFQIGDKVKMLVQSVGISGSHANSPLIRGVPDPDAATQGHCLTAGPDTPSLRPSPKGYATFAETRMSAPCQGARKTHYKPVNRFVDSHNARFTGLSSAMRARPRNTIPERKLRMIRNSAPVNSSRFPRPSDGYSFDGEFANQEYRRSQGVRGKNYFQAHGLARAVVAKE